MQVELIDQASTKEAGGKPAYRRRRPMKEDVDGGRQSARRLVMVGFGLFTPKAPAQRKQTEPDSLSCSTRRYGEKKEELDSHGVSLSLPFPNRREFRIRDQTPRAKRNRAAPQAREARGRAFDPYGQRAARAWPSPAPTTACILSRDRSKIASSPRLSPYRPPPPACCTGAPPAREEREQMDLRTRQVLCPCTQTGRLIPRPARAAALQRALAERDARTHVCQPLQPPARALKSSHGAADKRCICRPEGGRDKDEEKR
ncbi:hypothetical protein HU200_065830 [Digitaria exilis]|uniref:Uncharacterized protein n=1 Tax=Digitaria exilis TaxID=1010633 RepID=A0A834ZXG8_9POAL|nr:hypothetical protein HU200_065830 [Digitaria exilis]